jgi:hypothetical protein
MRLGALCLLDNKPRPFSRGDKAELQLFTDKIVQEIATRKLKKVDQRQSKPASKPDIVKADPVL